MIFVHQNLISNRLTYPVHAKSAGELISFGFSDRSVRSLAAKRSANRWDQGQRKKNDFTFWLIFGLSPNLGLRTFVIELAFGKICIHSVVSKLNNLHLNARCKVKWPIVSGLQENLWVLLARNFYSMTCFAKYSTWHCNSVCLAVLPFVMSRNIWKCHQFLSASLYFSKRGDYWDRLCRDVVGRWSLVGCHARALWPNGAS